MTPTHERIEKLHAWYRRNVLDVPQTPEVERLWLAWLKQGYNGNDLRDVIIYLRRQIQNGKRNSGALKLTNLFRFDEGASCLAFAEDLALARGSRALRGGVLEKLDDGDLPKPEPAAAPISAPTRNTARADAAFADFRKLKETL
jgi:hypothetical protein